MKREHKETLKLMNRRRW